MHKGKKIIAHRGLPVLAPENTMGGFKLMEKYNVDWFETDVTSTSDGELVIIHDDYLDRTTNKSGEVSRMNYSEIKDADTGFWFSSKYDGEKLPTMRDIVDFVNETKINLNIELKGITGPEGNKLADSLVHKLKDFLDQIDPNIEILISSFNSIMLAKMHNIAPEYEYAILFEQHTLYPDWQLIADACGAKTVHLESERLTYDMISEIKKRGYNVNVWTVNDHGRANELFNWGVDGIFTDVADTFVGEKGE
ncbi:glycerophosphoryl diester phosphodiesterase [Floricoccus penangensis]|uniref:Glycerophosphoryl diester phosphodiesterase n=1 Tax=Floricoccus penangensis TaxID=1859475 RepID=A0A9Q5JI58_9LACT|nr:glycerophosphodiester phosphodiesterase family protein [Floricoccus penangensis]OFI48010.1 glycerophosphoryl diester phosphodiesterase [Floricoccus penangensis]